MTPPEHMGFFSSRSFSQLFGRELPFKIVHRRVLGKWTNLGFLFYKIQRVSPMLIPGFILEAISTSVLANIPIYVPTDDIQYVVAQKLK